MRRLTAILVAVIVVTSTSAAVEAAAPVAGPSNGDVPAPSQAATTVPAASADPAPPNATDASSRPLASVAASNQPLSVTLVDLDTRRTYTVRSPAQLASLDVPMGRYLLVRYERERGRVRKTEQYVERTPRGFRPLDTGDIGLRALVERGAWEGSYAPNDTVRIWVGAVNESTTPDRPVANLSLTLTVEYPNGTTETITARTGATGNALVEFPLDGKPTGGYNVVVESANASDEAFVSFQSGTHVELYPGLAWNAPVAVNKTVTVAAHLTEAGRPVAGATHNLTIRAPNGSTTTRTVTTDAAGYATVSFTPTQEGEYEVSTPTNRGFSTALSVRANRYRGRLQIPRSWDLEPGSDAHIVGHVVDGGQPLSNTDLVVTIVNTTDWDDPSIVTNISVTTNDQGQFAVTWTTSDDVTQADYRVRVHTADGDRVTLSGDRFIDVEAEETADAGPSGPNIDLDADFDTWQVAPGQSINLTVRATENGTALADETVTVTFAYGWQGVPAASVQLTTNDDGIATYTFEVPESAPSGENADLLANAVVEHEGATASGTAWGEIHTYTVEDGPTEPVVPGTSVEYAFEVHTLATGQPVADLPVMTEAERSYLHTSTFFTGHNTTRSNGRATLSIGVPADAQGIVWFGDRSPVTPSNVFSGAFARHYDVGVHGLEGEQTAGQPATFNYSTTTDEPVAAIVVVSTWNDQVDDRVPLATIAQPGEEITFTPPADTPDGTWFSAQVWTVTSGGNVSFEWEFFQVTTPDTAISLDEVAGSTGSNVTVPLSTNASNVASFQANITFNNSVVEVVSVSGTEDFGDPVTNVQNDEGWVFISNAKSQGTDSPTLAKITFHIVANNSTSTPLSFVESDTTISDEQGDSIPLGIYDDGKITAQTCTRGDANGDGEVTSGDATLVLRAVVGLTDPDTLTDCADANNDGELTSGDATIILRIVVGLI